MGCFITDNRYSIDVSFMNCSINIVVNVLDRNNVVMFSEQERGEREEGGREGEREGTLIHTE